MANYGESAYGFLEKINYVRVSGTDGERQAAEIIRNALSGMGLTPQTESFEIDSYEVETATLTVTEPFTASYTVTGYGFSGSTPPEGIRAPFYYAEDANDIAASQSRGKIVLINGQPTGPQYRAIVEGGAVGFIAISGAPIDERDKTDLETRALRQTRHLDNGKVAAIPGVSIRAIDALEMLKRKPREVVLTLVQEQCKTPSQNVIVEIEGTDKADEWITFGAHYDSVPFSRGMYDNGAGSAIILEACRYYATNKPRRSLRFIWFGAEEKGLLGSLHHISANPQEIERTKMMINVDLAGHVIGNHTMAMTTHADLGAALLFMAKEIGFSLTVRQDIFSSDSTAYADAGVPSMSFYRAGTGGHNRYDIIDLVSADSLNESVEFLIYFSRRIVDSEIFPVKPEIPEDLKEKLEVYFCRKPAAQ